MRLANKNFIIATDETNRKNKFLIFPAVLRRGIPIPVFYLRKLQNSVKYVLD